VPTPEVWFYEPGRERPYGYIDLLQPGVAFIRHGMDFVETRSTMAHEVAHLAGTDEREARRYEADRRRGAWLAPIRAKPAEPTADEWAMHAAQLRARSGR
jgi:hypothetical protein